MSGEQVTNNPQSTPVPQDLYAEPKFVKKRKKRQLAEGAENSVCSSSIGPASVKNIISSIVPQPIRNLEQNYKSKVQGRHIALKRSDPTPSKNQPDYCSKPKKKGPTNRQVRFLQLEELIKIEQKRYRYENFIPLHKLWLGYMSELLEVKLRTEAKVAEDIIVPESATTTEDFKGRLPSVSSMQSKLLKADYHGAYMIVQKAKNPSLIGVRGIVIQESEQVFKLIDSESKIKVVPKPHCIFQILLPLSVNQTSDNDQSSQQHSLSFNIFGNQFAFRPTDRVNKKFKSKAFSEL